MALVRCLFNQKGGTAKAFSTANLGFGFAREGKKVLVIDCDPQASLTASLGYRESDELPVTLATMLTKILEDKPVLPDEGILHHDEGVDLMPANIELSGVEASLANAMCRETILRQYVNMLRPFYSEILLDSGPSLTMLPINVLAAADGIIIPVLTHYLPTKGLVDLLRTVSKIQKQINPSLTIDGILLTMYDGRTNLAKGVAKLIRDTYGNDVRVFRNEIPFSIRAAETSVEGVSIYEYDPGGRVAAAYEGFTKEVLELERD